jgi:chromosomal replication initiator protein
VQAASRPDGLPSIPPSKSIKTIQRVVSAYFNVDVSVLISHRRDKAAVIPRHVACFFSIRHTRHSLSQIGEKFGGRDHTTILYAKRKIQSKMDKSPEFADTINKIESIFSSRAET